MKSRDRGLIAGLMFAVLFCIALASQAEIAALHEGANDPWDEGWLGGSPGGNVSISTGGVHDDMGHDAWVIDDDDNDDSWTHHIFLTQAQSDAAAINGWKLSARLRVIETDALKEAAVQVAYYHYRAKGFIGYRMQFDTAPNSNKPIVALNGYDDEAEITLNDPDGGYHLYELIYDQVAGSAALFVDGVELLSGFTGKKEQKEDEDIERSFVNFGSEAGGAKGHGNYSLVKFEVPGAEAPDIQLAPVGLQKQLLVDDYVVAEMENVTREMGEITRENGGKPILVADEPWEQGNRIAFYMTVLRDEEHDKFKMWYLAQMPGHRDFRGREADITGVAYAESDDGINWTKPPVGLKYSELGLRDSDLADDAPDVDTNIVIQAHGFSCFIDPTVLWGAPDKYKAAFDSHFDGTPDGGDVNKTCLAYSPDGINWTYYNDGQAVTGRAADTQSQILWDPTTWRYMLIARHDLIGLARDEVTGDVQMGENRGTRVMAHSRGNDLVNHPTAWETLQILGFDRDKWMRRQIHAFTDWIYEGVHFGFMGALEHYDGIRPYADGTTDLQTRHEKYIVNFYISTSRDAVDWELDWVYAEKPLIPRGPAGSFDKDGIHVPNLITYDDRHWIYYCGLSERFAHPSPEGLFGVGLATLRLDGFVCLEAKDEPGIVVTKPFRLAGNALQVNVDAESGEVSVEVLDAVGKPIPGFSANDAIKYEGVDELRLKLQWKGNADLSKLEGRPVRLKFHLRNAKLYAFQIQ